jgi:hypothetical protein
MVSFACPLAHWSDSAAPIRCRYLLSRVIPVRNCASILASFRWRVLYNVRVCLPGSAMSISREYPSTPSGRAFCSCCFALAMFIIVDLARYSCPCGKHPCSFAHRAASFAFLPNPNSACAGTHAMRMWLPPSFSVRNCGPEAPNQIRISDLAFLRLNKYSLSSDILLRWGPFSCSDGFPFLLRWGQPDPNRWICS